MENIRTLVCKNFTKLVDSSPLSKREIARQMNISEATLQRWKTGASFPEHSNLEKLAKVLGVSDREFYADEEPIVKTLPMEEMFKRMASIPGKVYELAAELGDVNDEGWEEVIMDLKIIIEDRKLTKKG